MMVEHTCVLLVRQEIGIFKVQKKNDFFGIAIRIGKEYADDVSCGVFHLTIQIGYGQFTVGIAEKEL